MNVVKERAQRILKADKQFAQDERKYLCSVMKTLPQEDLLLHLESLNLPELKAVVSCGVPGFAQNKALKLLEEKKRALDVFIENDGIEAVMNVETEDNGGSEKNDNENVCTSESGRESDSGKIC